MQKRLIEKLAENKRRLLKSEIKEKLVPCAERGFTYRFADLAQAGNCLSWFYQIQYQPTPVRLMLSEKRRRNS